MKEIKVEFHRFDNFVFGRVVSMPEELRGVGKIISNDSYSIYSYDYPASNNKTVALRGCEKDRDNYYFGHNYETLTEAKLAISNFENLIRKWNAEHREILDGAEKKYLSAVIKPFKNRIVFIKKKEVTSDNAYIYIRIRSEFEYERYAVLEFPVFKKEQMYKEMEIDREYTLKELGLE